MIITIAQDCLALAREGAVVMCRLCGRWLDKVKDELAGIGPIIKIVRDGWYSRTLWSSPEGALILKVQRLRVTVPGRRPFVVFVFPPLCLPRLRCLLTDALNFFALQDRSDQSQLIEKMFEARLNEAALDQLLGDNRRWPPLIKVQKQCIEAMTKLKGYWRTVCAGISDSIGLFSVSIAVRGSDPLTLALFARAEELQHAGIELGG